MLASASAAPRSVRENHEVKRAPKYVKEIVFLLKCVVLREEVMKNHALTSRRRGLRAANAAR